MRKIFFITSVVLFAFIANTFVTNAQMNLIVSLTGSVFDQVSKQPVKCRIEAYNEKGKRVYVGRSNPKQNGYYYMTGLKPGQKYKVKFVSKDFLNQEVEVVIPETDKYAEFSKISCSLLRKTD